MLSALWCYRGFILSSVKRDFHSRYVGSVLGAAWAVLNPLALILVYTVVFSQVMKARLPSSESPVPYGLFLCAGVLPWAYFAEVVSRCQTVFLEQANLIKKSAFPRSALPVTVAVSASINFAIVFGLFVLALVWMGRFPGWPIVALAPLLLIQQAFAMGLGLVLGTLNVFFRDIGQVMGVVLQFWFWLTPIVYPIDAVNETIGQVILKWNPLAPLVVAYQGVVVWARWPDWPRLAPHAIGAGGLLLLAYAVFRRLSVQMADEL